MPQHETSRCPRCSRSFECKAGNISECQCATVPLRPEERTYISGQFQECLCAACLRALQFEYMLRRNKIGR